METKAKRTLVKSAPELWELADDHPRLESWMGGIVGSRAPVEIEITERVPGRRLGWRSVAPASEARMQVALRDSGFGTAVEITATNQSTGPVTSDALERLLDELGTPDRRPFSKG
ncbi:MAG: hypothetical protein M3355_04565 [Actinomycetota bacterium]|nr:hypothetical protein [Actinomycetota bacterium]